MDWPWAKFAPYFDALECYQLTPENLEDWMANWSRLTSLVMEANARYLVGTTSDTTDEALDARFKRFLEEVFSKSQHANQQLRVKLINSGLEPDRFSEPLKRMKQEVQIFCEENLPLFTEEKQLNSDFGKIIGAQAVLWNGEEKTLAQLEPISLSSDREEREKAWRVASDRRLQDREKLNALWAKYLELRLKQAENAGCASYMEFIWKQKNRFDYSPEDCVQFHESIEKIVVPAAQRRYEERREALELDRLRPWDLNVDLQDRPPLKPFGNAQELIERSLQIFRRIDSGFGSNFELMRDEHLLDLENRQGKAPGGYCTGFQAVKRPFIFMNSVGLQRDVRTMLHEAGHAFHAFEKFKLPYLKQGQVGSEFNEVASMAMELLASPYLTKEQGGFYSEADSSRAQIEHLEKIIQFWPYMAVVDAFQHWVYMNPEEAMNPASCDEIWSSLWDRFMIGVDWSGLKDEKDTGWHRKLHIFQVPFYYVEYGMAQLGAVQIWENALKDQETAVKQYRESLALGGTVPLPVLYETAGARFAFDQGTIQNAINLLESQLQWLIDSN